MVRILSGYPSERSEEGRTLKLDTRLKDSRKLPIWQAERLSTCAHLIFPLLYVVGPLNPPTHPLNEQDQSDIESPPTTPN